MTRIATLLFASAVLWGAAAAGQTLVWGKESSGACPKGTKPVEMRHQGTVKVWKRGCGKLLADGRLIREGHWVEFYESGAKYADTYWRNDKKQGVSTWYHENGNKQSEYTYKDDKMDGPSVEYSEDGKVVSREVYKDDNVVKPP